MKLSLAPILLPVFAIVAPMGFLVGCQNKHKTAANPELNPQVTDVAAAPAYSQPMPVMAADPVAAAPVAYSSAAYTPAAPAMAPAAGGSKYTVKKGDTLFSISKAHYGTGGQWSKITAANPGLSPKTLQAGKTIVLP